MFHHSDALHAKKHKVPAKLAPPPAGPLPPGFNAWQAVAAAAACAPDVCNAMCDLCTSGLLCWTHRVDVSTLQPLGLLGTGLTSDVLLAIECGSMSDESPPHLTGPVETRQVRCVSVKRLHIATLDGGRQRHRAIAELRALAFVSRIAFPPPASVARPHHLARPLHPCIVPLIGCSEDSEHLYIVEQVGSRVACAVLGALVVRVCGRNRSSA